MKKTLFILNYRAGTNLWSALFGKKEVPFSASKKTREAVGGTNFVNYRIKGDGLAKVGEWEGSKHSFFLPTIPERVCPCENYYVRNIDQTLATNPPTDHFSWHVQIGDWWGHATGDTVPDPYQVVTPVRFGPDELVALPGDDWKIVYMLRDGRNQIESLRNIPGGIEQDRHRADPKDYFVVLCKAFRNRAQMVVDSLARLPNFKVVKFEDFTSDWEDTIVEIYNYIDLVPDMKFIKDTHKSVARKQKQHSSFAGKGNLHNRWEETWSDWEKETFENIAGELNRKLGY